MDRVGIGHQQQMNPPSSGGNGKYGLIEAINPYQIEFNSGYFVEGSIVI
jgi:hypothetical protein